MQQGSVCMMDKQLAGRAVLGKMRDTAAARLGEEVTQVS